MKNYPIYSGQDLSESTYPSSIDMVDQNGTVLDTFENINDDPLEAGNPLEQDYPYKHHGDGGDGSGGFDWLTLAIAALKEASAWGRSAYNNKKAEKAATKEYERQLDFWHKQNEYNSYSNQRKLAEDAGLNYAAMYSNGAPEASASGLSNVPGNEYAKGGILRSGLGSIADSMLDSQLKMAQIKDIQSSANLKDTQAGLAQEQTVSQKIENALNSALDDIEFEVPGLGTYKGARLTMAVGSASQSILKSYSDSIGYKSQVNEFDARESYNFWEKKTGFEVNILYDQVYADLKRSADLDLSRMEIARCAQVIADLGSQMVYRTQMASISAQELDLAKDKFTVDKYAALSKALIDYLSLSESERHNKATEGIGLFNSKWQNTNAARDRQLRGIIDALEIFLGVF